MHNELNSATKRSLYSMMLKGRQHRGGSVRSQVCRIVSKDESLDSSHGLIDNEGIRKSTANTAKVRTKRET